MQRSHFAPLGLLPDRTPVKSNVAPAPVPAAGAHEHLVVPAGRLTANKGVDVLLDPWTAIWPGPSRARCSSSSPGADRLDDRVRAWAVSRPAVHVAGLLGREECAALVARARAVLVLSTSKEGFGLVAVEAIATGVPPIISNRGAFPELVTDGVDGELFEAG